MKYRKEALGGIKYLIQKNLTAFLTVVLSAAAGILIGLVTQNSDNEPSSLAYGYVFVRYGIIISVSYAALFLQKAFVFKGKDVVAVVIVGASFTFFGKALFMLFKFGGVWGYVNAVLLYAPMAVVSAFMVAMTAVKLKTSYCFDVKDSLKTICLCWGVNVGIIVLLNVLFEVFFDIIKF